MYVSTYGWNHAASSSMVGRTFTKPMLGSISVNTQLLHQSQCRCRTCSPRMPPTTGSPSVTRKPASGIAIDSEKALALIFWQPVQWHAIVSSGGAVISKRNRPHRQPPVQGRFQSFMAISSSVGEDEIL
ncbi:hypothetical protein OJJOAM_004403 [Cupriavidus sp. H18C1]